MDRQSTPFAQLSATNRGPLVLITCYIFFISSCLAVLVKIWTRVSTAKTLAYTDVAMLIALGAATGQAITITESVNHGLGKHIDDLTKSQLKAVSQNYYAASILEIIALACAKASVTLLVVSIQPLRPVLVACYAFLGVVGAWLIAGVFALAFQCGASKPWVLGSPETCSDQYAIRVGLGTVDMIMDIVIVGLAYWMMLKVQVASGKKWSVVALFALRLATPPFTAIALATYHTYYYSTPQDRTWHAVTPAIWTQIALNISIVTACIPSIKRFFADVQSGLMGVTISEQYELTHSGGKATQIMQSRMGTGVGSRLASRFGISGNRSQMASNGGSQLAEGAGDYSSDVNFGSRAKVRGGGIQQQRPAETESVKGLTSNAIHQKIDYEIEFEERESEGRPSR